MAERNWITRRIHGFEALLGVHITLNDLTGSFGHLIEPANLFHDHSYCLWVKSRLDGKQLCGEFDNGAIVRELGRRINGFVKFCHGGVAEISLPIMRSGAFAGYLAAGPYRWMFDTALPSDAVRTDPVQGFSPAPSELLRNLRALDDRILTFHLEALRSLVDSLQLAADHSDGIHSTDRNRKHLIEFYLGKEFHRSVELSDLAVFLNLSVSRTGAVIQEIFSVPFSRLLQEIRISHAKNLLQYSLLSVSEIAGLCGFPNQNYLYRLFRKIEGVTPIDHRRKTQRELAV
ncbi:MAG: helix-turn-helix domain-containing protein [Anaerolineae bacterium]|nr:helix-turn-helix domain-containing protein [Anaerolineae bacterium]